MKKRSSASLLCSDSSILIQRRPRGINGRFHLYFCAVLLGSGNGWIQQSRVTKTTFQFSGHQRERKSQIYQNFDLGGAETPSSCQVSSRSYKTENNLFGGPVKRRYQFPRPLIELLIFAAWCLSLATAFITMEDYLAMPSKYTTQPSPDHVPFRWGSSTVKGLAFGESDRKQLALLGYADENTLVATLPSYNEIMLQHRMVHVPRWAGTRESNVKDAIHTVCISLQRITYLNQLANQYDWGEMRQELHNGPLADLSFAVADLGRTSPMLRETAGFDWGSCAWRHCGALADAQEAVDELDSMLGVLEPFEARFCLDIVERSLRDILSVVDWGVAAPEDKRYYATLPKYESMFRDRNDFGATGDEETSLVRSIDDAYLRALQELRVD